MDNFIRMNNLWTFKRLIYNQLIKRKRKAQICL